MRKRALGSVILAFVAVSAFAQPSTKRESNVAKGKYLVNNIAVCGDYHTPADKTGKPIESRTLQGSALAFTPIVDIPQWMPVAPDIARLTWTDKQAITFFTTGKRPDGSMTAPPMPQYRMSRADAEAITAYLKSLKKK